MEDPGAPLTLTTNTAVTRPFIAETIGRCYALERRGEVGLALRQAGEALALAETLAEPEAMAAALVCLATVRFRLGHYEEACALAEQALVHAASFSAACADALLIRGNCAAETYSLTDAEVYYHRAAELGREGGFDRIRMRALHGLSQGVYMPRGQFELALAADEEAYRLVVQVGLPEWTPYPLTTIAWICEITGHYERARATLAALGQVVLPTSLHQGYHHFLAANLALDEGDAWAAPALYAQARSIAEAIGEPGLNVEVRLGICRYHRAAGDAANALAWAGDALAVATHVGYRHQQGRSLIERGRAAWEVGETAAAESDLVAAIEILSNLGAAFDLARAWFFLAALRQSQQHDQAAATWLRAARAMVIGNYAFFLEQERALAFPLVATYLNDPNPEIASLSAVLLNQLGRVPPPPLQVLTLGRFEVCQKKQLIPHPAWRHRQAGELFRLLLISPGRSLLREQVIESLWPDKSPPAAVAFFHQATSALRRALEPDLPDKFPSRYLFVEEGRISLCLPAASEVDYEQFERHVSAADWEAALALYQGELFPADRYHDWATWKREQLTRLYLRALLVTAGQRLAANEAGAALDAIQRLLAIDPWQEQAVLLGMKAHAALHDRAGALRLYLNLVRSLKDELGVTPQHELQQLYQSLL
ncbi:MAG: BTAD domain-containing putative transcriptional regulator [Chloroflexota bacterium]